MALVCVEGGVYFLDSARPKAGLYRLGAAFLGFWMARGITLLISLIWPVLGHGASREPLYQLLFILSLIYLLPGLFRHMDLLRKPEAE